MKRICIFILLAVVAGAFYSCREDSLEKQRKKELEELDEFIRAHYAEVARRPSGLYYIELEEGTGDSIKMGDRVLVFFEIYRLNEELLIRSGQYEPLELTVLPPTSLSSAATYVSELKSLNEALTYMKKGSKARLIFDSNLGFGQYGSYGSGGFEPLLMDVEVYKVYPAVVPEESGE